MKLKITVHGVAYEVDVEVLDPGDGFPAPRQPQRQAAQQRQSETSAPPRRQAHQPSSSPTGSGAVTSPIAGTVLEIKCKSGDEVESGQVLLIVEAMKMKTSIAAPTAGKVKSIPVAAGDSVREGQTLVELE